MDNHNCRKVHQIVETCTFEWLEISDQINQESTEGEANGMEAVLFIDDERPLQNTLREDMEYHRTAGESHVDSQTKVIEPGAFEAEVSILLVTVAIAIDPTQESSSTQYFV